MEMVEHLVVREPEAIRAIFRKLQEEPLTTEKLVPLGLLGNALRGLIVLEIVLDKWPDFTTLIIKSDPSKMQMYGETYGIYVYSKDVDVVDKLLNTPGIIPWEIPLYFKLLPKEFLPCVTKAIEKSSRGGNITFMEESLFFRLENVSPAKKSLPSGYKIRQLQPSDAPFVNRVWPYSRGSKQRFGYVDYIIRHCSGYCVVDESDNIVVITTKHLYEAYAMGWTHPDYRRFGLMQHLLYHFVQESKKQKQMTPYLWSRIDNTTVDKMLRKINGYPMEGIMMWLNYEPLKGNHKAGTSKL